MKPRDLLAPLKAAERRDTLHLASRLGQYISSIMRYAVQNDYLEITPAGVSFHQWWKS